MSGPRIDISLFGTCAVRLHGCATTEIRGAKHRALIAMLATAPMGRRPRAVLQTTLWGETHYDSGHQNLRRALSDLRKAVGTGFDDLLGTTNADVTLDLDRVTFLGNPGAGPFLHDLPLPQAAFRDWVASVRADPGPIATLHAPRPAARSASRRAAPRVAVLSPATLGEDAELRVYGDWIAEQACRTLSRSRLISVISHLSCRAASARRVVIPEVRAALDVDYVLAGALLREGDALACDLDFIETATGELLWSRRLMLRDRRDVRGMQDGVAGVAQAVARAVAETAVAAGRAAPIDAVADHDLTLSGVTLMHRRTLADFLSAREYLAEAARRMPAAAEPHAWLAKWYVLNVFEGFTIDRAADTRRALDATSRALDMDPENPFALTIDGFARNLLTKDGDTARARFGAALDVNPNESLAWLLQGALHAFADDGRAAVDATDEARRLSPIDPFGYFYDSLAGTARLAAGDHAGALALAERSLANNDRHLSTHRVKVTALHGLGRGTDARAAAETLIAKYPGFRLDDYRREHPAAHRGIGQQMLDALADAGIQ